jgi:hypothetical protein
MVDSTAYILRAEDNLLIGEKRNAYWWESQKERDHWEHQDVGGWTMLKWILER